MKNTTITNVLLVYVEPPNANVSQDLHELEELIKTANGKTYFAESEFRSAPYFDLIIDGITVGADVVSPAA